MDGTFPVESLYFSGSYTKSNFHLAEKAGNAVVTFNPSSGSAASAHEQIFNSALLSDSLGYHAPEAIGGRGQRDAGPLKRRAWAWRVMNSASICSSWARAPVAQNQGPAAADQPPHIDPRHQALGQLAGAAAGVVGSPTLPWIPGNLVNDNVLMLH